MASEIAVTADMEESGIDNIQGLESYLRDLDFGIYLDKWGLQRLRDVRLLGSMPYIASIKESYSRFDHTIGVGYLMAVAARAMNLPRKWFDLAVLTGLIHDLGHTPFSHGSEVFVRKHAHRFHEAQSVRVASRIVRELRIDGEVDAARKLQLATELFRSRTTTHPVGKMEVILHELIGSVGSMDMLDGVTRTARSVGWSAPDPIEIAAGFSRQGSRCALAPSAADSLSRVLSLERRIYQGLIYSPRGLAAQAMLTSALEAVFQTKSEIREFMGMTDTQAMQRLLGDPVARKLILSLEQRHFYEPLQDVVPEAYESILGALHQSLDPSLNQPERYRYFASDVAELAGIPLPDVVIIHPFLLKEFVDSRSPGQSRLDDVPIPLDWIARASRARRSFARVVGVYVPPDLPLDVLTKLRVLSYEGLSASARRTRVIEGARPVRTLRGGHPTPLPLIDFIVNWAIRDKTDLALDSSFGEGTFLIRAVRRLEALGATREGAVSSVYGVELDPRLYSKCSSSWPGGSTSASDHLLNEDFFDINPPGGGRSRVPSVSAVIGNPPFIRHHDLADLDRAKAQLRSTEKGIQLGASAGSWASHLLHSLSFLRTNGRLAMVLPRELLTATYAGPVRAYLTRRFSTIRILNLAFDAFPSVSQRTVLLLAERGGQRGIAATSVTSYAELSKLEALPTPSQLPHSVRSWFGKRWTWALVRSEVVELLGDLIRQNKLSRFGDVAEVKLGLVTGADGYFVVDSSVTRRWSLGKKWLSPVLARPSDASGAVFTSADFEALRTSGSKCSLVRVPADSNPASDQHISAYLEAGKRQGVSERYKCSSRDPWFSVPWTTPPDAFMTYKVGRSPRLCLNQARVGATNKFHYVNFSTRADPLLRSLTLAGFYSSAGTLTAELVGRSLGGIGLEVGPRDARMILIPNPAQLARESRRPAENLVAAIDQNLRNREPPPRELIDRALLVEGLGLDDRDVQLLSSECDRLQRERGLSLDV